MTKYSTTPLPGINNQRRRSASWAALLFLLPALLSCSRDTQKSPYVARVGRAELTEADMKAAIDTVGEWRLQAQAYVNDWIITELLYQEALRRDLAESDEIWRQLESTKKRLVIAALLEKELFSDLDTLAITDEVLKAYLDSAANEFALPQDVMRISYTCFARRNAANTFRSSVLNGTPWPEAVLQAQEDSTLAPHLLQIVDRQFFTRGALYPEELWRLARSLGEEEISFVLRRQRRYYIIKHHGTRRRGEMPELDYVRDEIRDRILIEHRRIKYEALITALRSRQRIDLRITSLDTAVATTVVE
ncbi:MAG: peptidyl-prolyl cis-trans isomerase [Bacteroidetes bacterium]|nr:peptidyl-prolyl cis-trans isomerase [Bacteroidota bacterium]